MNNCESCKWWSEYLENNYFPEAYIGWGACELTLAGCDGDDPAHPTSMAIVWNDGISGELMTKGEFWCMQWEGKEVE